MSQPERKSQYTENVNAALQWMWGDGYLSPGGAEEVAAMLRGVDVAGRNVLEIGSGLGAASVTLVEKYGAHSVLGVDVEAHLVEHSRERARAAGLDERVRFRLVDPGPLPFDDGSHDMVFSKDAIVHIPDKAACYAEVLRVLAPGGVFVGSDWLRGGEDTYTSDAREWLEFVHLDFRMETLEQTRRALERSGFEPFGTRRGRKEIATLRPNYESWGGVGRDASTASRAAPEAARHRQGFLRPTFRRIQAGRHDRAGRAAGA